MVPSNEVASAFLDLVGIRDLAQTSPDRYWEALGRFQEHVANLCHNLEGAGAQIFLFSDSLFVQGPNAESLVKFVRSLRHNLLVDGLYFKGSIKKGDLEARPAHKLALDQDREAEKKRAKKLFGHCFGQNAATLFAMQERLKGVGFWVDSETDSAKQFTVSSCFLPQLNSKKAEHYLDLILLPEDLDEHILDRLLQAFFKAKARSKKIGRFYVPFLIVWIQSMELKKVAEYGPGSLVGLLLNGTFERLFGDVAGIENLFYCLFNRLHDADEEAPLDLAYQTRRYILGRRRIARALDDIPEDILSHDARNAFLEEMSAGLLGRAPEYKAAVAKIKELTGLGNSDLEIGRALESKGYPAVYGRAWTGSSVRKVREREGIGAPGAV